ncbi:MAG: alpha-amylase [Bacteroidia bacterium]|nr:alpha-amylase [Bacteroidia bacterium]
MQLINKRKTTAALLISPLLLLLSCGQRQSVLNNNENIKEMDTVRNVKTVPEWTKNASIYEVNIRQFTEQGTFKAFEKHLPRIKELGADIIWFMPIQPLGIKNHKGSIGSHYAIRDYTAINPDYGAMDEFKKLVKKIHKSGMYVIIDWVANHSAWDNIWTIGHPEFFNKDSEGNFIPPVPDWTDVIDFNYENKALWDTMINAMKFWIKETDIDGFRCDVAEMVTTEFWNKARCELDKVKPVLMLAEAEKGEFHQKAFDITYSWKLMHTLNDIAKGKKPVSTINSVLEWEKNEFLADAYRMRFTSNHDENSWNGTEFERYGKGVKTFAVLTFTLPGIPLIYNGQESAMNKSLSFFDKDSVVWDNYQYSEFYKTLFSLKKENKALWNGEYGGTMLKINACDTMVYAFMRKKENNEILILLNLSASSAIAEIRDKKLAGNYKEIFSKKQEIFTGIINIPLKAWEYRVYIKQ